MSPRHPLASSCALSLCLLLTAPAAPGPFTNSLGMQMVRIEAGTFTMGQNGPPLEDYLRQKRFSELWKAKDQIDFDEAPAHPVKISHPFLMGVTEVTVAQYRRFDPGFKQNDPKTKPAEDDAAGGVTWEKAVAFCEWLSAREGKNYRLPTEAEWEYACRAGTTTLFHTGDSLPDGHQKWFGEENYRGVYFPPGPMPPEYDWRGTGGPPSKGVTQGQVLGLIHPAEESRSGGTGALRVAQKKPNAWGLHDMHGNVAEWCLDWHGPYEGRPQTDPLGRSAGDCRVFRGGFHSTTTRFLRAANRGSWVPNVPSARIGFRVVQAELPKGELLPRIPPLTSQNVSQTAAPPVPHQTDTPLFDGPKPFVRIPDGAVGPVFCSQNHSPSLTECPNGDLLAVWFSTIGETDLTTSVAGSRLRLGSKEWDPASAFWDAMDVNDHAPKIWWDGDRTLYHIVEARQHGDVLIRQSTDNGVTWSKARPLRSHGETSGNPIRTRDGVLAVPFDFDGLSISRDNGRTWTETGRARRGTDSIRPGEKGPFIAGIHAPIVELADGRLMAFGRFNAGQPEQEAFRFRMPVSYSSDLGHTWHWEISEFPVVSNTQRPAMIRLREGPVVLCSFTDEARTPFKERKGMPFPSTTQEYTGYGLYAAVSYDEGKTWPHRRLLAPEGKTTADINGYLALTQSREGFIQLITSKDHYTFNLAWLQALPASPKR